MGIRDSVLCEESWSHCQGRLGVLFVVTVVGEDSSPFLPYLISVFLLLIS